MIQIPDTSSLLPTLHRLPNGRTLALFPSSTTDLVKIDFMTESGTAYQIQPLVAGAATRLSTAASRQMDSRQLSEFFDYRGILLDHNIDVQQSCTTFYSLHRHIPQLLPILQQLMIEPTFPEEDLEVYRNKRRHEIMVMKQKAPDLARKAFYQTLFGTTHPLGRYAEADDVDRLTREQVLEHYRRTHSLADTDIVLSGKIDDALIAAIEQHFAPQTPTSPEIPTLPAIPVIPEKPVIPALPATPQASLRIGRILPLSWDDPDYAHFLILTTLLGGYFGSRLMSNLREDKGYTYGIYARTQIYRGVIVFNIVTDVARESAEDARNQISLEIQRLIDEPVSPEELEFVKNVFAGDFIRSVDGVFEQSQRYIDMHSVRITELLTDNLRNALLDATPSHLQNLAARHLSPSELTTVQIG